MRHSALKRSIAIILVMVMVFSSTTAEVSAMGIGDEDFVLNLQKNEVIEERVTESIEEASEAEISEEGASEDEISETELSDTEVSETESDATEYGETDSSEEVIWEDINEQYLEGNIVEDNKKQEANCVQTIDVTNIKSNHSYGSFIDESYEVSLEGANAIVITFDSRCDLEGNDFVYIYNSEDEEMGKYGDRSLAGRTLRINGDKITIRLVNENNGVSWGFELTEAYGEFHEWDEGTVTKEPDGFEAGEKTYTCSVCGGNKVEQIYQNDALGMGSCGENANWVLDNNGVLTISGSGNMVEYYGDGYMYDTRPWRDFVCDIKKVVIEDGITSISPYAFINCTYLAEITIPEGIVSIGNDAFGMCDSLSSIKLPSSLTTIGIRAFSECSSLKDVYVPNIQWWINFKHKYDSAMPTYNGANLYADDELVTEVVIPEGTESINDYMFYGCTSVTTVKLPNTLKLIGDGAFCETGITTVEIPNGVEEIGANAFYNCKELVTAVVPETCNVIGSYAFGACEKLTDVSLPISANLNNYVFYNCTGIKNVILTKGTGIGATYNGIITYNKPWDVATGVTITIGSGITSIKEYTFRSAKISALYFEDCVNTIESGAFSGATVDNMYFTNIKSLCESNFGYIGPFSIATNVYVDNKIPTEIVIPEGVEFIGDNVFGYCDTLTSVTLPSSVTSIGDNAFKQCSALREFHFSDGLVHVGDDAFYTHIKRIYVPNDAAWCKMQFESLYSNPAAYRKDIFFYIDGKIPTTIQVPDGSTCIGDYAFSCLPITSIEIPEGVTSIGEMAFYWSQIESIVIPESVTAIGKYAFYRCANLVTVTFPESLISVDENAFDLCKAIQRVNITDAEAWFDISFANPLASPMSYAKELYCNDQLVTEITFKEGITSIDDYKYQNCGYIKNIVIPEGVEKIGKGAFYNCTGLTSVYVPKSVKTIDSDAFKGCTGLQRVEVEDTDAWFVISFGNEMASPMYYATELYCGGEPVKEIVLPEGTTVINARAYQNCNYITSIVIPEGVTEIGEYAFDGCTKLENVVIPKSVEEIGMYAFRNCTGLKKLTMPYSLPITDCTIFDGCTGTEEIYLTKGDGTIPDYTMHYYATPWYEALSAKVVLEEGITGVGKYLFNGCFGVKEVIIPDSVISLGDRAFYNCRNLNKLTIPYSLEIPNAENFYHCYDISDLTLTKGTGAVPDYTGSNKEYTPWYISRPSKLTIGAGITEIGAKTFSDSGIEEISLPEGLEKIGEGAFEYSYGLKSVNIPSTLTQVDANAFYVCDYIEKVEIADLASFCTIEFANKSSNPLYGTNGIYIDGVQVKNLVIPDGVKTIKAYAFPYSDGISSITIPHSVTLIEDNALLLSIYKTIKVYEASYAEEYVTQNNYTNLEVMHNYEYVETIESTCTVNGYDRYVCSTCQYERHDELPLAHHFETRYTLSDGKEIKYCIHDCGLTKEEIEEEPTVTGTCGDNLTWKLYGDYILVIEGTGAMDTYDVDAPAPWSEYEFGYCIIKEGVTTIGYSAFDSCDSLEYIKVPNSLTAVESYAFYGCSKLKEVEFEEELLTIGQSAFERCGALSKLRIYEKTTEIASSAFNKCGELTIYGYQGSYIETYAKEKEIPFELIGYYGKCGDSIEWYLIDGELSFKGSGYMYDYSLSEPAPWAKLPFTGVNIDGSILSIGNYAFDGRSELDEIELPYNLFEVGDYAFRNCTGLTKIELPLMFSQYGDYAFMGCTGIQEITFPESDFTMGDGVFSGCTSLKEITIPGIPVNIGCSVFEGCTALESVTLQGEYEKIPKGMFKDCEKLTSFTFPEGITSIEEAAFEGCGISTLELPTTLIGIGARAFALNPIQSITLPDSVTTIAAGSFLGCDRLETFVVNSTNTNFSVANGVLYNKDGTTLLLCPSGKSDTYTMSRKTVEIATGAFLGCEKLTSIVMPSSLTTIGACAFSGTSVEIFEIPSGATDIDFTAFFGCEKLSDIIIDEDNEVYISEGKAIYSPDKSKFYFYYGNESEITIPEGVATVGADAFIGCKKGTQVYLPYTITSLESLDAFKDETVIPYFYLNCGYLRNQFKSAGVSYRLRGYAFLEWSNTNEHLSLAYDNLSEIIKRNGDSVSYKHDTMTLEVSLVSGGVKFLQKYTSADGNSKGELTYIICENGVYQNKFNYKFTKGLAKFTGGLTLDPRTIGNSNNYSYDWNVSGTLVGDPITDSSLLSGVNNIANMLLYSALLFMQEDIMDYSPLYMADFGFVRWDNTNEIHRHTVFDRVEPTCTENGAESYSACSLCNATTDAPVILPATGHTVVIDEAVEATCTTDGCTEGSHCSVCHEVLEAQEVIPAFDHSEVVDEEPVEPTCTIGGRKLKSHCSVCNEIISEGGELPALGHTKVVDEDGVEATCTEKGRKEASHCSVCNEVLSAPDVIEALGHDYDDGEKILPNCTEEGYTKYVCKRCKDVKKEDFVKETGHTEKIIPGKDATETESGLTEGISCSVCGEILVPQTEIPALGYEIIYHLAGSTNAEENPARYSKDSERIILAAPVAGKKGYRFAGWYFDENYTKPIKVIPKGTTGTLEIYAKWVPYTYTVIFVDDSGTESSQVFTYGTEQALKKNSFKKAGCVFAGWSKTQGATEETFGNQEVVDDTVLGLEPQNDNNAVVMLYSVWRNTYNITYHDGSEILSPDTENYIESYVYGKSHKLPVPQKEGYVFAGWYKDEAYKKKVASITSKMAEDLYLYAKWTPCTYSVKFDANTAAFTDVIAIGSMKSASMKYDVQTSLPANKFVLKGYKFKGWSLTDGKTEVVYTDEEEVSNLTNKKNAVVTLYAQWEETPYYISYETNGGELDTDFNSYHYGDDGVVLPVPVKQGYIFDGWYRDTKLKKAVSKNASKESILTKNDYGDMTLYAKWSGCKYQVVYDADTAEVAGVTALQKNRVYGKATALTKNGYKRVGYQFIGWSLKPESSATEEELMNPSLRVDFTNGQKVSVLGDYQESVTLYAVWDKWIGSKYDVVYNADATDATGIMAVQKDRVYGTAKALSKNSFKRADYVFIGWSLTPVREATEEELMNPRLRVDFEDGAKVESLGSYKKSVALYAVWDNQFEVTVYSQGGSFTDDETELTLDYTYKQGIILPEPKREGYTFGGWYRDVKYKKAVKRDTNTGKYLLADTDFGDLNLYAKWTANKYDVVFDADAQDATGRSSTQKKRVYGISKALSKNGYKRKGYKFIGWSLTPISEATEEEILNPFLRVDFTDRQKVATVGTYQQEVVLYAVWEKLEYSITYKNMNFVGDQETLSEAGYATSYAVTDSIVLKEPERLGYTFLGWYTDKNCKKKITCINPGTIGDKVIYAKWKINK